MQFFLIWIKLIVFVLGWGSHVDERERKKWSKEMEEDASVLSPQYWSPSPEACIIGYLEPLEASPGLRWAGNPCYGP